MPSVLQARCPGCRRALRIPTAWIKRTIRCKHCGLTVRAQPRTQPVEGPEPPALPLTVAAPTGAEALPPAFVSAVARPAAPAWESGLAAPAGEQPFALEPAFAALGDGPIIRMPRRQRPSGGKWAILAGGLGLLAVTLTVAILSWPRLTALGAHLRAAGLGGQVEEEDSVGVRQPPPGAGLFPRRALAICVSNYLYANPVSYGPAGHDVHNLVSRMAHVLHIAQTQLVELSDARPARPPPAADRPPQENGQGTKAKAAPPPYLEPPPARPPLKATIQQTITQFLDTSRAQDHIFVIFVGHVIEHGGQGYLVPLEGELTDEKTLLPLAWLYDRLEKCKAQQKVLILDPCRLDPARGLERPGSGPMGKALDALLRKPPPGVQVWSACSAEQYSYEVDGAGIFLDKLAAALSPQVLKGIQRPQDPLPVERLAEQVNRSTAAAVDAEQFGPDGKARQMPRLSGQAPAEAVAYDSQEPLPVQTAIPMPALPSGGMADRNEIRRLLQEIRLPPIKLAREETTPLALDTLIPFDAKRMAAYGADYASLKEIEDNRTKYPLRAAVLDAVKLLNRTFDPSHPAFSLRESFMGGGSQQIKQQILREQMKPAKVLLALEEELAKLRKSGEGRDQEESKRWQAHYDYVLAQLLARIAYVHEYDQLLGRIRKDELPELKPNIHTGWRLASRDKLTSGKEAKAQAAEAKKIFSRLARKYKGTPWEILAKRAQLLALGLEWQPTR